jgi:hypothetical protein
MRTVSPLSPFAGQAGVHRDGDGSGIRARRPADRSRPATLLRPRGQRPAEVVAPPERALAAAPPARTGAVECIVPRKGLLLPRQLPFQAWLSIGSQLSAVANSSAWCLGDWLAYGETAYNGRYRDAIEHTSLDYQTLRNYAWVARSFELSRRRDTLSFGHHAEVAALPEVEQDFWLRKAEELDWSRNQLRREVRASLKERGGQAGGQPANGAGACPNGAVAGPAAVTGSVSGRAPANGAAQANGAAATLAAVNGAAHGLAQANGPAATLSAVNGPAARAATHGAEAELTIMVTPAQLKSCEEAASRAGLSICAWAARALADAARNSLTDGAGHG